MHQPHTLSFAFSFFVLQLRQRARWRLRRRLSLPDRLGLVCAAPLAAVHLMLDQQCVRRKHWLLHALQPGIIRSDPVLRRLALAVVDQSGRAGL